MANSKPTAAQASPDTYAQQGIRAVSRKVRLFTLLDALVCPDSHADFILSSMMEDLRLFVPGNGREREIVEMRREIRDTMGGPYTRRDDIYTHDDECRNEDMVPSQRFLLCCKAVEDPELLIYLKRFCVSKTTLSTPEGMSVAQIVALYQNTETVFRERYNRSPMPAPRRLHFQNCEPSVEWLRRLRPSLQSFVLGEYINCLYTSDYVSPLLGAGLALLHQGDLKATGCDAAATGVFLGWAGIWHEAEVIAEGMDQGTPQQRELNRVGRQIMRGSCELLMGHAAALGLLRDAIDTFRRLQGMKQEVHFGMHIGLARNLARFLYGEAADRVDMREDIDVLTRNATPEGESNVFGASGFRAIMALDALRNGDTRLARQYVDEPPVREDNALAAVLYYSARLHLDLICGRDLGELRRWHERTRFLPVMNRFFADILRAALPEEERALVRAAIIPTGTLDVTKLVRVTSAWEMRLTALEELVHEADSQETATRREKRLVWIIDYAAKMATPVEQTLTSRGVWSRGTKVAIKKLLEKGATIDWLKPQDNRIIAAAQSSRQRARSDYQLSLEVACEAMVDHPFLAEDLGGGELRFIKMSAGVLEYALKEQGESVILTTGNQDLAEQLAAADIYTSYLFTRDEEHNIYFHRLNAWTRKFTSVIRDGLEMPRTAMPRIIGLTKSHAFRLQAEDITAEELPTISHPVMQVEQTDEGFRAVFGVRPFGHAGTPFYPTGEGPRNPLASITVAARQPAEPAAANEAPAEPSLPVQPRRPRRGSRRTRQKDFLDYLEKGEDSAAEELETPAPRAPAAGTPAAEADAPGQRVEGNELAEDAPEEEPQEARSGRVVKTVRVRRDFPEERDQFTDLVMACPALQDNLEGRRWFSGDPEDVLNLLDQVRQAPVPCTVEWPRGGAIKLGRTLSARAMHIRIEKKEDSDWFGLTGDVQIDEKRFISIRTLLNALRGSRFVSLGDGEYLALTDELRRRLSDLRLVLTEDQKADGFLVSHLAAGAVELALADMEVQTSPAWEMSVERMHKAFAATPEVPRRLQASLRDYQREGYEWMQRLAIWGVGACLADDMGLGKTLQTIAVMLNQAANGPCLVVAPTSVCANWEAEIERFAPSLATRRLGTTGREATVKRMKKNEVLVVGYGLLTNVEGILDSRTWAMVVFDEAQALKNADTKRARAGRSIQADFRVALTGTPIENRIDDLWSLFNTINPGLLGTWEDFRRRFGDGRPGGASNRALRALIRPFILRRLKSSVLNELPARTEQNVLVEPNEKELVFYESMRRAAVDHLASVEDNTKRFQILAALTKLRRACCHPGLADADMAGMEKESSKTERFMEIVQELVEGGHKVLAFSQFTTYLAQIRAGLDERKIAYQYLDGATPEKERRARVAAFQEGQGDVFLLSLKAGGTGINLTAADYVIHLDPWWNPAVEDQASDRAHRMGQKRPVTIYRMVMAHSVEEKILALHAQKRELAADFLEGTDTGVSAMSEEDLLNLLRD